MIGSDGPDAEKGATRATPIASMSPWPAGAQSALGGDRCVGKQPRWKSPTTQISLTNSRIAVAAE